MMLAEKVAASDALAMGMIYKTFAPDELLAAAQQLAATLAAMPTRGLALTKQALNASAANDVVAQLDVEERLQREAGNTEDFREGVAAFLQKRAPRFTGR